MRLYPAAQQERCARWRSAEVINSNVHECMSGVLLQIVATLFKIICIK